MADEPKIRVMAVPALGAALLAAGTPVLTFERDPLAGHGWVLRYLDGSASVERHFVGGTAADLDWALKSARQFLRQGDGD